VAAGLAAVGALCFALVRIALIDVPPADQPSASNVFVTLYEPPPGHLEAAINISDGQAWAALGADPTASHPERFKDGPAELVYRAQRPLYGWLIWGLSLGQRGGVAPALLALTCVSIGALAAGAVVLADRLGRNPTFAPFAVLMPGAMLSVVIVCPEALSVALALFGVAAWLGSRRARPLAVLLLTLAVLGRETLVLVPMTLAVHQFLLEPRDDRRSWRDVVDLAPLAVPALVYGAWVVSLRARHGVWPSDAASLERLATPFHGWAQALPRLELARTGSFVLAAVLLIAAFVRAPRSVASWIAAAFALSTIVMGENVLATESYRPLLAMYVFAFIAVLPRAAVLDAAPAGVGEASPSVPQ